MSANRPQPGVALQRRTILTFSDPPAFLSSPICLTFAHDFTRSTMPHLVTALTKLGGNGAVHPKPNALGRVVGVSLVCESNACLCRDHSGRLVTDTHGVRTFERDQGQLLVMPDTPSTGEGTGFAAPVLWCECVHVRVSPPFTCVVWPTCAVLCGQCGRCPPSTLSNMIGVLEDAKPRREHRSCAAAVSLHLAWTIGTSGCLNGSACCGVG